MRTSLIVGGLVFAWLGCTPVGDSPHSADSNASYTHKVLVSSPAQPWSAKTLTLKLGPDDEVTATRSEWFDTSEQGPRTARSNAYQLGGRWIGHVVGVPGSAVSLVFRNADVVAGYVIKDGVRYAISQSGTMQTVKQRRVESFLPKTGERDCVYPLPAQTAARNDAYPYHADESYGVDATLTSTIIDLLVVYTASAATFAGGVDALLDEVMANIGLTDLSFANATLPVRARLAGFAETGMPDGATTLDAIHALLNPTDGVSDEVHSIRDHVGADAVMLITKEGYDACGRAVLSIQNARGDSNQAFATMSYHCLGTDTFPHELGHVLGLGHDRGHFPPFEEVPVAFPYSYGYDDNENDFSTIMAVDYNWIFHFANPHVYYKGHPTGIAHGAGTEDISADAARSLAESMHIYLNYRCASDDQCVQPSPYCSPNHRCSSCATDAHCASPTPYCNLAQGACSECITNAHCANQPTKPYCVAGQCATSAIYTPIVTSP